MRKRQRLKRNIQRGRSNSKSRKTKTISSIGIGSSRKKARISSMEHRYKLSESSKGVCTVIKQTKHCNNNTKDAQNLNYLGFDIEEEYLSFDNSNHSTSHFHDLGTYPLSEERYALLQGIPSLPTLSPNSSKSTRTDSLNSSLFSKRYHQSSERENQRLKQAFQTLTSSEQYQTVLKRRSQLPIFSAKTEILDTISQNSVCLITGNTGSGKSTQIPQFLLEQMLSEGRGTDCLILCTQPRRVAATSLAVQVSKERIEKLGQSVGYHIRFDRQIGENTKIVYITSGMLFQYLQVNPTLKGVSHVILDEAHERSLDMEMLLVFMKLLSCSASYHTKLVVMSATLESGKLQHYFNDCPIIQVNSSLFSIQTHFMEDILKLPLHLNRPANTRKDPRTQPSQRQ